MAELEYIDTHAHLYDKAFDKDRAEMLQRARDAGLVRVLLPNVDVGTIADLLALEEASDGLCQAMMGLHPCAVGEDYRTALDTVRRQLERRAFCGIGEIGLDNYWDKSRLKEQEDAFLTQVRWAVELGLPVSIHSREATEEALLLLEREGGAVRGVFHCFTGTPAQAARIRELGLFIGIGGVATFPKVHLAGAIREIGLEHVVLETDAPYLAPVPMRGKRNESAYLVHILDKLAADLSMESADLGGMFCANARRLFGG